MVLGPKGQGPQSGFNLYSKIISLKKYVAPYKFQICPKDF